MEAKVIVGEVVPETYGTVCHHINPGLIEEINKKIESWNEKDLPFNDDIEKILETHISKADIYWTAINKSDNLKSQRAYIVLMMASLMKIYSATDNL